MVSANYNHASVYFLFFFVRRKLTKKVKIFILSAPGLTLLLLSYLMIGAVTFNVLEGGRKFTRGFNLTKTISTHKDDKIKESVERLWKITENLNVLYKENWTKLAGEEITNLQDYFFEELTAKSDNSVISECNTKNYQSNRKKNPPFWNLGECFLYSLSLLTTVGKYIIFLFLQNSYLSTRQFYFRGWITPTVILRY